MHLPTHFYAAGTIGKTLYLCERAVLPDIVRIYGDANCCRSVLLLVVLIVKGMILAISMPTFGGRRAPSPFESKVTHLNRILPAL